jgi:phosphopantetheine--protein transferase-like protein
MKRNLEDTKTDALQALVAAITWAPPPVPGIVIAAFVDHGLCDENDLLRHLADVERNKALQLNDPVERRHFIVRRCFQRVFLKTVLDWKGALPDLTIEHRVDTQPFCPDAPLYQLSFSSSGPVALACAALHHRVGIDIEKIRVIANVQDLAARFFTAEEYQSLSKYAGDAQSLCFLRMWTAKEAGLKALGKGIVHGLNRFAVTHSSHVYHIEMTDKSSVDGVWVLHHLALLPSHIVAVVHTPKISSPDSL